MSNKTKGWLMLSPVIIAAIWGLSYAFGWWLPLAVIGWLSGVLYISKAISLIMQSE